MYAIVQTGGKQYRVEEGRTLSVERLPAEEGSSVELNDVLLIADDGDVLVGTPTIDGARVLADVASHGRRKKVVVFKYKAKVRTRKKTGHRQHLTHLSVTEILRPGQESKAAKPKRRRARRKTAEEKPEEEAATVAVAAPATEPAPDGEPKRRTRRAATPKAVAEAAAATADTEAAPADKPKRRARKAAAPKAEAETPVAEKAPAKRRTRKPTTAAKATAGTEPASDDKPAPRRRTRKKAEEE